MASRLLRHARWRLKSLSETVLAQSRAESSRTWHVPSRTAAAALPAAGGLPFAWAAVALLGGGVGVAAAEAPESPEPEAGKGWHLMSMDQRRRAFFKYEKRIRELSNPEKVFGYFASQGDLHSRTGMLMTPSDLMRSAVPVYPPHSSDIVRAGALPGEPNPHVPQHASQLLSAFDVDASGGISFDEWLLFKALLSIPEIDVDVAFSLMDDNGDGTVDREEFSRLLAALQKRADHPTGSYAKAGAQLSTAASGLLGIFFGESGKKKLQLAEFKKFLVDMREEIARLEFAWYDYKSVGAIGGQDFALSVVGCARAKHVEGYLDKIEAMPTALASEKITLEEFQDFRKVWRRLRQLAVAIDYCHLSTTESILTPEKFADAVKRVMGITLSLNVVHILYYLFENSDGKGGVNMHFMHQVLDRHFEAGSTRKMGVEEISGEKRSFFDCMSECTSKR